MITKFNIAGNKYGSWTAIREFDIQDGKWRWLCRCDCGAEKPVSVRSLKTGKSKSCGCAKRIDISGRRFGRWVAINRSHVKDGCTLWLCKCDCGNERIVYLQGLLNGSSNSCGCLKVENFTKQNTTHGASDTKEYRAWLGMKNRCYDIKNKHFNNYGGRGVVVCDRWLVEQGFENFLSDIGLAPSKKHSVDRFPNNKSGIYEPKNVRWATKKQQQNNRRSNVVLEYNGEEMTLTEWAEKLGESPKYFQEMVTTKGMSVGQIVNRRRRLKLN